MKTIIHLKTDKDVKLKAQKIAGELGVPLSTVINSQLKQFIRNRYIYLSVAPHMTSDLENLIGRVEEDIRSRKNLSPIFSSTDKAIKHLQAR